MQTHAISFAIRKCTLMSFPCLGTRTFGPLLLSMRLGKANHLKMVAIGPPNLVETRTIVSIFYQCKCNPHSYVQYAYECNLWTTHES